jgi:hypothetical protein|nr:MAG TPA: transmembrane protein [Caudoviricetes sp.]
MLYFILGGLTVWIILSCVAVFILDTIDPCGWDTPIMFTIFFPAAILVGIYALIVFILRKIKIILKKATTKKK